MSGLVSPHPCQHLIFSTFNFSYFNKCILISHCIFNHILLIANDIMMFEHLFICLFAIYNSLFDELSLCGICPFSIFFFFFFYCEFYKFLIFGVRSEAQKIKDPL